MNARKSTGNSSSCAVDRSALEFFKSPQTVRSIVRFFLETLSGCARIALFSRRRFRPHSRSTGADRREISTRQIRAVMRCVAALIIMRFRIYNEIDCSIGPGVVRRVKCSRIFFRPTIPCATQATLWQVPTPNMDSRVIWAREINKILIVWSSSHTCVRVHLRPTQTNCLSSPTHRQAVNRINRIVQRQVKRISAAATRIIRIHLLWSWVELAEAISRRIWAAAREKTARCLCRTLKVMRNRRTIISIIIHQASWQRRRWPRWWCERQDKTSQISSLNRRSSRYGASVNRPKMNITSWISPRENWRKRIG